MCKCQTKNSAHKRGKQRRKKKKKVCAKTVNNEMQCSNGVYCPTTVSMLPPQGNVQRQNVAVSMRARALAW